MTKSKKVWIILGLISISVLSFVGGLAVKIRINHIKEIVQQDQSKCSGVEMNIGGQVYQAPAGYGWYVCPEPPVAQQKI